MLKPRVIPTLLLADGALVKTRKFRRPVYVGDPINAVRIFNEKEADELLLLDIRATREGKPPDFALLSSIAREAFMPMAYGGGLTRVEDIQRILGIGFEKVVINEAAVRDPDLLRRAAERAGSQSIVAAVDVRRNLFGTAKTYRHAQRASLGQTPEETAARYERLGAGELLVTSVDRDGTRNGYDLDIVRRVSGAVRIPVIACGGAGSLKHCGDALDAGASAVAAGSLFVFYGDQHSVLITYPSREELDAWIRERPS